MGARPKLTHAISGTLLAGLTAVAIANAVPTDEEPPEPRDPLAASEVQLKAAQTELAKQYQEFAAAQQRHERAAKAARDALKRTEKAAQDGKKDDKKATAGKTDKATNTGNGGSGGSGGQSGPRATSAAPAERPNSVDTDELTSLLKRTSLLNVLSDVDRAARNHDKLTDAEAEAKRLYQIAVHGKATATSTTSQPDDEKSAEKKSDKSKKSDQKDKKNKKADKKSNQKKDKKKDKKRAKHRPKPDTRANSLAASGVANPARGTFTSGYGARWGTTHYGVDIANEIGTPVRSVLPGTVISSGPASGFGLWVRVQHDNGLITVYGHIDRSLVTIGQRVKAGQQVAKLGNEGQSTGPHLHFEVIRGGEKIDPLPWLNNHGIKLG